MYPPDYGNTDEDDCGCTYGTSCEGHKKMQEEERARRNDTYHYPKRSFWDVDIFSWDTWDDEEY